MAAIPVNQLDLAGKTIPGYWSSPYGEPAELRDGPLVLVVGSQDMSVLQLGVTYKVLFKARMKEGTGATTVNLRLEPGRQTAIQKNNVQINPSDNFQSLLVGTFNPSPGVVRVYLYNMEVNAIRAGLIISEVTFEED